MPLSKLRPTTSFDPDRLAALRAILPEAFADGKINWETLREALGETLKLKILATSIGKRLLKYNSPAISPYIYT